MEKVLATITLYHLTGMSRGILAVCCSYFITSKYMEYTHVLSTAHLLWIGLLDPLSPLAQYNGVLCWQSLQNTIWRLYAGRLLKSSNLRIRPWIL